MLLEPRMEPDNPDHDYTCVMCTDCFHVDFPDDLSDNKVSIARLSLLQSDQSLEGHQTQISLHHVTYSSSLPTCRVGVQMHLLILLGKGIVQDGLAGRQQKRDQPELTLYNPAI